MKKLGTNERPNILLIYTDQQRYDSLNINGNKYIKTPNIDEIAKRGVVFSNSFVTTPLCVPSRTSFFTCKYSHSTSCYNNDLPLKDFEEDVVTLLKNNGYRTCLFGKNHCFSNSRLYDTFDIVKEASHLGYKNEETDTDRIVNEYRKDKMQVPFCDEIVNEDETITSKVCNFTSTFIEEDSQEKPFFVWLSIPDPHPPYMVAKKYKDMYKNIDLPLPKYIEGEMDNKPFRQKVVVELDRISKDYPTDKDLNILKQIYYGMVTCIDYEVGKVISVLERKKLLENTIIIYTSDHGDYLGDHKLIRKGPALYDALIKVPLIFYWKNHTTTKRTDAMVCNIDVMATILDILDVEGSINMQGKSFKNVLFGIKDNHRDKVFLSNGDPYSPLNKNTFTSKIEEELLKDTNYHNSSYLRNGSIKGIRTKQYKYCYTKGDIDEYYDLEKDPFELNNMIDKVPKDRVLELRNEILNWLLETEEKQVNNRKWN